MRNRNTNIILRGVSILFLTGALILSIVSLISYSRQRNNYPAGMSIAGVSVGGLTPAEASQRLLEVYTSPVEILYNDAVIHIDPGVVGFKLTSKPCLQLRTSAARAVPFWGGFWDYLWNRTPPEIIIPLSAKTFRGTPARVPAKRNCHTLRSSARACRARPRRDNLPCRATRTDIGY